MAPGVSTMYVFQRIIYLLGGCNRCCCSYISHKIPTFFRQIEHVAFGNYVFVVLLAHFWLNKACFDKNSSNSNDLNGHYRNMQAKFHLD